MRAPFRRAAAAVWRRQGVLVAILGLAAWFALLWFMVGDVL